MLRGFLTGLIVGSLLIFQSVAFAAPTAIDTSSSANATAETSQRKTFFDSANEVYWAFYYNGTAIEYSYSADGEEWSSAGTLPYNTSSFSVAYKNISGTSYVLIATEANDYDIIVRRGTISSNSIAFDAAVTVYDGSGIQDKNTKPHLATDGDNQVWVSTIRDYGSLNQGVRYRAAVRRSTNAVDGDLSLWEGEEVIGTRNDNLQDAKILSRIGDEMYLLLLLQGNSIVSYTFDGADWILANEAGDYSSLSFPVGGLSGTIVALVFSGDDLYIGGSFSNAAELAGADNIVRYNLINQTWHDVGGGVSSTVRTILIDGEDIYVGGAFQNAGGIAEADRIARWNEDDQQWYALGNGSPGQVNALAKIGTNLYVGGSFSDLNTIAEADNMARWSITGEQWFALGSGLSAQANALAVDGTDLYIGGSFQNAGTIAEADRIVKWNTVGSSWAALDSGITNGAVLALIITGTDLYVGGSFINVDSIAAADRVARWSISGSQWFALGTGMASGTINSLAIANGNLYAGGSFPSASGVANTSQIARWNITGSSWHALAAGSSSQVNAVAIDDGEVFAGGSFVDEDSNPITSFGRFDGSNWNRMGGIKGPSQISSAVSSGENIYVAGTFIGLEENGDLGRFARFDGTNWHQVGTGLTSFSLNSVAILGNEIFVGVDNDFNTVWRYDGANWQVISGGVLALGGPSDPTVTQLVVNGTDLYALGAFNTMGGVVDANYIARWDGANWHALTPALTNPAYIAASFGGDLYVGGEFTDAGGVGDADRIARWDGDDWNAVGGGLNGNVYAMAVMDGSLYVAGAFTDAGGIQDADYIARWDGNSWHAVSAGLNDFVFHLTAWNGELYLVGNFSSVDGDNNLNYVVKWNGEDWGAVDGIGTPNTNCRFYELGERLLVYSPSTFPAVTLLQPSAAADVDSESSLSATTDALGDLYLTYTNDSDQLRFRRYDESNEEWNPIVTLNAAASSNPTVTYKDNDGRVTVGWVEANAIKYIHALTPYEAADFSAAAILYDTGTNASLVFPEHQTSGDLPFIWTNGTGNPYNIYVDTLDMTTKPILAISSTAGSSTNDSPIPITIQFEEDVTGFAVGDVSVSNGTAGNFVAVDGNTYTLDITPSGQGEVTVNVAAAVAKDIFNNDNLAAAQFSVTYDTTSPTVLLSTTSGTSTQNAAIPVVIQFDEEVSGFSISDISATNATLSNFAAADDDDDDTYSVKATATTDGTVQVFVAAGIAEDAAGNTNTASTILSIRYKDPNLDSDGDGVVNVQEEVDGTNLADSGSYLSILPKSWCSDWNGFLGMYNINEYLNFKNTKRVVVATVFDINGDAKSSLGLDLLAGRQTDLLVHDLPGWTKDSYGKICSEIASSSAKAGDVDGRMVYYKPNDTGYDFAFAQPYYDGLRGSQFLTFNTYQPSSDPADQSNLAANWIQLANLENTTQSGTLYFYNQDGSIVSQQAVTLIAEARQDFSAHALGGNSIGMVEWRPSTNSAKFSLRNIRYYYNNPGTVNSFDAALQLEGVKGNGEILTTLLDARNQTAVLEVGNTTASTISVAVKIYDTFGTLKNSQTLTLPAYASQHIVANQYLDNELGLATVDGSSLGSVLSVGMHYGKTESGGIKHIYGVIATQSLGTTTKGTYNTYLGQGCELFLINPTNSAVTSLIEMKRLDGTVVLSGERITTSRYGVSNFDACGEDEADQYGVLTVTAATTNAIKSLVIRSGVNDDYRFVTPVR